MLELTSKLEDREMQRIIKRKEESKCKPEFEIAEIEKVDQIERGEKQRKHSRSREHSLQQWHKTLSMGPLGSRELHRDRVGLNEKYEKPT